MRFLLIAILGLLILGACSSIECSIDNVVESHYLLRRGSGFDTLKTDTITITAARTIGQDTTLYNKGTGTTGFFLPMSYDGESDVLYLHLVDTAHNEWCDTITILKSNQLHLESVECSPQYYHTLLSVSHTTNIIDSIVINDPNVTNDATKQNLFLYLRSH